MAQLRELRGTLGEAATFAVVKNTLTKIAVEQAGLENELAPLLTGPSAVAFVTGDVVETAKGLRDFAKANPFLVIKGGVLDGKALTPAEITTLADLEPREVLLAKLAGAMKATRPGPRARSPRCPSRWHSSPRRCALSARRRRAAPSPGRPGREQQCRQQRPRRQRPCRR